MSPLKNAPCSTATRYHVWPCENFKNRLVTETLVHVLFLMHSHQVGCYNIVFVSRKKKKYLWRQLCETRSKGMSFCCLGSMLCACCFRVATVYCFIIKLFLTPSWETQCIKSLVGYSHTALNLSFFTVLFFAHCALFGGNRRKNVRYKEAV